MKTTVKIIRDYYGETAYEMYVEYIDYLVNELNVFCEIANNKFINVVEQQKRYFSSPESYTDKIVIEAKGYCQGEWQRYVIYYNEKELNKGHNRQYFDGLCRQLKRSFTHFNQYFVEKYETTEIDGKTFTGEPYDFKTIVIDWIEFPTKEHIAEAYFDVYGKDYDELIIKED